MLQIGLEESAISTIGHQSVWVYFDPVLNIDVLFAILIEEEAAEVGSVGDVRDFFQILGHIGKSDQVLEPRESNMREFLLCSHGAQCLAIKPGLLVRNAQQICQQV